MIGQDAREAGGYAAGSALRITLLSRRRASVAASDSTPQRRAGELASATGPPSSGRRARTDRSRAGAGPG